MQTLLSLCVLFSLTFAPAPFPKPRKPSVFDADSVRKRIEGTWVVESCKVGGIVQGGPGPRWETVRIEGGTWSQSSTWQPTGKQLWTTPYLITIRSDASRIDMNYKADDPPLLYGVLRLEGDRLFVTHATSGPVPTSHVDPLRNGQVRWILRRARD